MMKNNYRKKMIYFLSCIYLIILVSMLIVIYPAVSNMISQKLQYMSAEILLFYFFMIIVCIAGLLMIIVVIYQKNNLEKNGKEVINIAIDNERSYIERQISELNEKLVSTDERWREAYHLIMASQERQVDSNGIISTRKFLEGFGININEIKIQTDLVFVLTPFHEDYSHTYSVISETCHMAKMLCMKGNEEFIEKGILQHVIKCIVRSHIIIANLNGRNPNVFYELGIAHALNKPTILIAHTNTKVPVDVNNQYLVLYTDEEELKKQLFDILLKILTRYE